MSLKKALLAATVLSLPVAAQAQPITGLYIGGGVGANYREDGGATVSVGRTTVGVGTGSVRTNWGYTALGSIGWGFGNGLRVELEGNYRNNAVRRVGGASTSGGTIHQYGAMANALFDFNFLNLNAGGVGIVPYVGAGVGYGWNDWRNVNGRSGSTQVRTDDRDGQFAYQGIAGVAFGLDAMVPGLALTAEYRFYGTLDPELGTAIRVNGATVAAGTYKPTNYNHSILAGVRYAFNAPRPAPVVAAPVAAAPAPARTYLVFFDWDRADLTDRARQIIAEAATNARAVSATRIEVSGHADRTGTAQYNQRLSVRRAEAVAAELVRRGIARNEITIQGFGFDRPLVPTAMGVREPQNRRVEIVLR
ncbi:OmpA family protein [Roseococcus sp. SYP-B2431]|uniref:OmpA family protein n=1 Tax=Roseococcus sp. SYP-B2431 TaxID=2496640 RepID=UPI00103A82D2|nr:OmpA family protein [Roseococcus sp. SYP-B2431]TCI00947.1 OmpA family protein [Roseococcus sp. SYP-B2431]